MSGTFLKITKLRKILRNTTSFQKNGGSLYALLPNKQLRFLQEHGIDLINGYRKFQPESQLIEEEGKLRIVLSFIPIPEIVGGDRES